MASTTDANLYRALARKDKAIRIALAIVTCHLGGRTDSSKAEYLRWAGCQSASLETWAEVERLLIEWRVILGRISSYAD